MRCLENSSSALLTVGTILGWQAVIVRAACSFRFAGYTNLSRLPTWTLPVAEPYSPGITVLNDANGIVYFGENYSNCS